MGEIMADIRFGAFVKELEKNKLEVTLSRAEVSSALWNAARKVVERKVGSDSIDGGTAPYEELPETTTVIVNLK
jgi:hypothetical protein